MPIADIADRTLETCPRRFNVGLGVLVRRIERCGGSLWYHVGVIASAGPPDPNLARGGPA